MCTGKSSCAIPLRSSDPGSATNPPRPQRHPGPDSLHIQTGLPAHQHGPPALPTGAFHHRSGSSRKSTLMVRASSRVCCVSVLILWCVQQAAARLGPRARWHARLAAGCAMYKSNTIGGLNKHGFAGAALTPDDGAPALHACTPPPHACRGAHGCPRAHAKTPLATRHARTPHTPRCSVAVLLR